MPGPWPPIAPLAISSPLLTYNGDPSAEGRKVASLSARYQREKWTRKIMKFASFIEAKGADIQDSREWVAQTYIPSLKANASSLRGAVYRLSRPSPGTFFDQFDDNLDANFGRFDVLIESWFSSTEDFRREVLPLETQLAREGLRYASYHVVPRLMLDPRIAEAGPSGARPEITSVCAIRWNPAISKSEVSRLYERHAAIALRAQNAVTKYEQNMVEEVMSWSDGVVWMDAYADFSHATVEACRTGLLASREEQQDTSKYVAAGRFSYLGDAFTCLAD